MLNARLRSRARLCSRARLSPLAVVALALLVPGRAGADEGVMGRGDAAVTQFSGTTTEKDIPKNALPADVTFIDEDGASLKVLDLSKLNGPPDGKLADTPARLSVKARDIGQVFGVALDSTSKDQPPNIYAGASSLYGLQIIGERDGRTVRLVQGEPGARWMPGQFGLEKGGGPGSIWKIDGTTEEVTLLSTIISGDRENAGPGLGAIAFDGLSKQLYVSSLETGLIHRLDVSGRELSTFDHGTEGRPTAGLPAVAYDSKRRMDIESPDFSVEDPATWGYADKKRLVVALAVENDRLYYSVADGPVIWSVGLGVDGSFLGDARLEIDVTGTPNNNMITSIAFDGPDNMYLTQRGERAGSYDFATFAMPQKSSVLHYTWSKPDETWVEAPKEFAIGTAPVHRATNGGVALGYGYDKTGNIDYGACRETLWTTGEHLIEGSGGGETVHGLQGSSKSLGQGASATQPKSGSTALQGDFRGVAEQDLTKPEDVWFTDTDEAIEGSKAHGYVGAIAVFAPCDGEEIVSTTRPPPGPTPPRKPAPGIFVTKECFPGLVGGAITCRISVTNTGIEPSSPVSITDVSTIIAGPGAGSTAPIVAFTPDAPGWFCTPVPTTAFECMLPSGVLLPGLTRFVDVVVNTGPLAAAGNFGFRNCAVLGAPFGGEACDDGGTGLAGLTIAKTGPAQCNPATDCTFVFSISNTSNRPFNGTVQISDAMFVGGAGVAAPITATDLACDGGNPAALPFTCTMPASIPAHGTLTRSVTVTMPAAPPNYWAQNCFAAFDPAFVPPGGPFPSPGGPGGPGFGSPTNPACHWVAAGAPPPQSNLRISKTNTGVTCDSSFPSGIASCRYAIDIKNDGPSPFNSPISLNEVPPAGSNLTLNPNWPCVPAAPGFTCTSPAAIAIAPGDTFTLEATIAIPALLTEPTCQVPNTASITSPVGAPTNVMPGDDSATATHNTALIAVLNPDGTVSVSCDPTNLKTEKTVDSCETAGGNTTCKYRVTVTNTGPDPYQGPINIEDQFGTAPTSVSFSGGFTCSGSGSSHLCSKAGVQLAPPGGAGDNSISLEITATFPNAGQCVVRNSAHMSFPPPNTRFNGLAVDDRSSVSTPVDTPECRKAPTCERPAEGETASISGACVCEAGQVRDKNGRCTPLEPEPLPETEACPDGSPMPEDGICSCKSGTSWNPDSRMCEAGCVPGANEYKTNAGQCACKTGFIRRDGRCVDGDGPVAPPAERCEPGPNEYRTAKGNCYCRQGFYRDEDGVCIPEPEQCEPGPNERVNSRGDCVCRDGYYREGGRCVRITIACELGPNEYRSRNGDCVCERGFERNSRGICEPVIILCRPGPNEYRNWRNQCVCREGFDRDVFGRCVPEIIYCGPGLHLQHGRCVPDWPDHHCERGWYWDTYLRRCVRDKECGRGEYWDNKLRKCVPDRGCSHGEHWDRNLKRCVPDGGPDCGRGEHWDRERKTCVPDRNPIEECQEKGGRWEHGQCIKGPSDAELCKRKGGEWDGKRCREPVTQCPPGTSGKYPNCKKDEAKECPPGTSGKYPNCKKDEAKECPPGTSGKYPNCKKDEAKECPPGTSGKYPNCKKDEAKECPPGTSGKYPNCKKDEAKECPPGTSGKYPNCKKDKPSKEEKKQEKQEKQQEKQKQEQQKQLERQKLQQQKQQQKQEKQQQQQQQKQQQKQQQQLQKQQQKQQQQQQKQQQKQQKQQQKQQQQQNQGGCPKNKVLVNGKCVKP